MHGARTALRYTAPELGAGESQDIAQHPEKRHIGGSIDISYFVVDSQTDHVTLASSRQWQGVGFLSVTIERPAKPANGHRGPRYDADRCNAFSDMPHWRPSSSPRASQDQSAARRLCCRTCGDTRSPASGCNTSAGWC